MTRTYNPIAATSEDGRQLNQELEQMFSSLGGDFLLRATELVDVQLSAGINDIPHELGRAWTGYLITRQNTAANIFAPDGAPNRTQFLRLRASISSTVSLRVW